MMKKDQKRRKTNLKNTPKEEGRQQYLKEQAQKEKEAQKAKQAERLCHWWSWIILQRIISRRQIL